MAKTTKTVETTTLDSDVTKPSVTAPGDGPADTTDPTERATSVTPNPGDEALLVGTVNAVKPLPVKPRIDDGRDLEHTGGEARTERYEQLAPNGDIVTVERDIETGKSKEVGRKPFKADTSDTDK